MSAVFCPGCGARIEVPTRLCPHCHEVLPAPPTVVGYGNLPDTLPTEAEAPSTKRSHPPPSAAAPAPQPAAPREPIPPEPSNPVVIEQGDEVKVSRLAHSYPNPHSELGREAAAGLPWNAPELRQPAPDAPAPTLDDPGDAGGAAAPAPIAQPPAAQGPGPFVYGAELRPQAPQHRSGTENVAPLRAALEAPPGLVTTVESSRRGLAGGALCGWSALLLLAAAVFSVLHGAILARHGYWNASDLLHATAWLSFTALVPALVMLGAGISLWLGKGAPRALAIAGALAHTLWSGAAIFVLASLFRLEGTALWAVIATAGCWLGTLGGMAMALATTRHRAP